MDYDLSTHTVHVECVALLTLEKMKTENLENLCLILGIFVYGEMYILAINFNWSFPDYCSESYLVDPVLY